MKKILYIYTLFLIATASIINPTQASNNKPPKRPIQSKTTIKAQKENKAKININTANTKELQKIKGIGEKKAQAIINYRKKNGNFKNINDILKIESRGINQKWFTKIKEHIKV